VAISIPAPIVVSGQCAKHSAGALRKSTNTKVSHLRLSGSAHVKDQVFGHCCIRQPVACMRPSSRYPGINGYPSSDSGDDESWSSDAILLGKSASPSASRLYMRGGASDCEHSHFGGYVGR
jgi:hypothetical protein